jgi:hypothetical protein
MDLLGAATVANGVMGAMDHKTSDGKSLFDAFAEIPETIINQHVLDAIDDIQDEIKDTGVEAILDLYETLGDSEGGLINFKNIDDIHDEAATYIQMVFASPFINQTIDDLMELIIEKSGITPITISGDSFNDFADLPLLLDVITRNDDGGSYTILDQEDKDD